MSDFHLQIFMATHDVVAMLQVRMRELSGGSLATLYTLSTSVCQPARFTLSPFQTLQPALPSLWDAIRTKNADNANAWRQNDQWATVELLARESGKTFSKGNTHARRNDTLSPTLPSRTSQWVKRRPLRLEARPAGLVVLPGLARNAH